MACLLFVAAVRGNPVGDELFLLFVQGELCGSILSIALFSGSEVCSEAPMRFWRDILREPLVTRQRRSPPSALANATRASAISAQICFAKRGRFCSGRPSNADLNSRKWLSPSEMVLATRSRRMRGSTFLRLLCDFASRPNAADYGMQLSGQQLIWIFSPAAEKTGPGMFSLASKPTCGGALQRTPRRDEEWTRGRSRRGSRARHKG